MRGWHRSLHYWRPQRLLGLATLMPGWFSGRRWPEARRVHRLSLVGNSLNCRAAAGRSLPSAGRSGLPSSHRQLRQLRPQPVEAQQCVQVSDLDQREQACVGPVHPPAASDPRSMPDRQIPTQPGGYGDAARRAVHARATGELVSVGDAAVPPAPHPATTCSSPASLGCGWSRKLTTSCDPSSRSCRYMSRNRVIIARYSRSSGPSTAAST